MSLGVKSLWRAQSRISLAQPLSLLPREFRNLPAASTIQARCRLSSLAVRASSPGELDSKTTVESPQDEDEVRSRPALSALVGPGPTSSSTVQGRRSLRRKIKTQVPSARAKSMIKPAIQYPSRRASRRSLRKHVVSTRRQARHEFARDLLDKSPNDWRSTLDFMIRHTPKFGEMVDFKVGISKGAAAQARATLSGLDTNLWQIQQRHHCKIHVESGFHEDEPLILSLSGSTVSVRESLLEIVQTVGKVAAVRVLDPALQISPAELWRGRVQGQLPIQLLGDGEPAAGMETVTLYGPTTDFAKMAERPKHKPYKLKTRADEIIRPHVWTKTSFEEYVAKLVFARLPTHLHRSLYPVGLSHQATVVQLLTSLFSSEDSRTAMSVTALKMALQYIHSCGPVFRPAARTISNQAELQQLPLDAEVFHTFLKSAARSGDIQGFNSVLKAMRRKGHYMRVETWTSFLFMIQDPKIKFHIMRKMRSRGLHRLRPILEELGRHRVILDLERSKDTEVDIERLLLAQNKQYGPSWLNTITLNNMIDVLGSRGDLRACHELLDSLDRDRVRLDHYTLNTMMTHTRSIPQKIKLLSRWPELDPDDVTYHILFQAAWKQRLPNMLRVIWRYSVFANLSSSKMRYTLTILMRPEPELSKSRALFLKQFEDVIMGRSELDAGRLSFPNGGKAFGAVQLMNKYREDAGNRQPLVPLETKLQEAYEMDMRIHKLISEGTEMTSSVKDGLTVDIPMGTSIIRRYVIAPRATSKDVQFNIRRYGT